MSTGQWTRVGTPGVESLDTVSPIAGISSLRHNLNNTQNRLDGLTVGAAVTSGKIRSMIKIVAIGASGGGDVSFGLFGMMQGTISDTSNAYWVYMYYPTGGPANVTLRIGKGLVNMGAAHLDTATIAAVGAGTLIAMELKWQRDATSGYVNLTASTGPDYSNLVVRKVVQDTVSPYATGVSAGLSSRVGFASSIDIRFDTTQIWIV